MGPDWWCSIAHLDTYSNQEVKHGTQSEKPAREWTCILYLNDDFRGGETYVRW